jgi:hypothetical protein
MHVIEVHLLERKVFCMSEVVFSKLRFATYGKIIHCLCRTLVGTRKNINKMWNYTKCGSIKFVSTA